METTGLHNLPPELPSAGFFKRLFAALYDWLLVIALMMVLSVPVVAPDNEAVTPGNPLYRAALIGIIALFFVGFWKTRGQTLGMRAWRLLLTDVAGQPVTLRQAALRFAFAWLSLLAGGLGFLWVLIDPDKLSWHDRWSGTRIRQLPKKEPAG